MGAIGTGNTRAGVVTASFGTSGTIYACAEKPVIDPQGEIAAFCDSTNRWLPLLCTMNVTTATEMVRKDFDWTHERFEAEAGRVPARSSGGLMLLPYLEGERTPNVPHGTGVWFGANQKTFTAAALFRPRRDGRRHDGHELRLATIAPARSPARANTRDRRRGQVAPLATAASWPIFLTRKSSP